MDSRNNNYMLDGANNNDDVIGQRAGSQARTPVEAIAEFQVVTNQYDAEFGRTTGAIINAISKQGSNAFHGVGAALLQDASMTRPDFFVEQNGLTKPRHAFQTYRANLGGPIVRDKAHFFFNLERVMVNRPNTITIPSHPEFNASPVTKDRVWNTLRPVRPPGEREQHVDGPVAARVVAAGQPDRSVSASVHRRANLAVTQNASREEHDVDQTVVGTLNRVLANTKVNTVRVNFTREDVAFANPGFNANGQDQAALKPHARLPQPSSTSSPPWRRRASTTPTSSTTRSSWFIPRGGSDHDVKLGGQYEYVGARSTAQDNLNGIFFFRSDAPFNAGDPRTYPERLQIRVPGRAQYIPEGAFRVGIRAGQVARSPSGRR